MSEGQLLFDSSKSINGEDLAKRLPPYFPRDDQTINFWILDAIGANLDRLEVDITDIDNANTVQTAETVDELHELGKLVDVAPKTNEGREKYRVRVMAEFMLTTAEGTAKNLVNNVSVLLNIPPNRVRYEESSEGGLVILWVPASAVEDIELTVTELSEIITGNVAASYRVEGNILGTFEHISAADSIAGADNPDYGYDGLDINGDPEGTGGTYAGTI